MLELRRQCETFAEMLGVFIDREARAEGRDLEESGARLSEVDRAEVEPVDHRRRLPAERENALAPRLVLVHRRCPGDVMDRACTGRASLRGRLVVGIQPAATRAARLPAVVSSLELQAFQEAPAALGRRAVRTDAVEALHGEGLWNVGPSGDERLVPRL